jgi:hypothetical protein
VELLHDRFDNVAFLTPIPTAEPTQVMLDKFKRSNLAKVKPLMVIMAVRRIPQVQRAFGKLRFIDRVFFKNFNASEISGEINSYLQDHSDGYTHIMLSSDDITPSPANIRQLMADVAEYDLPIVAGYCNICEFDKQDSHGCVCGCCVDNKPHRNTNATFEQVRLPPARSSYKFVPMEWALLHPGIYPVWFQGNACGMIRKEILQEMPLRSWNDGEGGLMQDLAMAFDLAKREIPQFVDFRVGMRHYGTHHGRLLVGKEPRAIEFQEAKHERSLVQFATVR